jgi:hypothetical protein
MEPNRADIFLGRVMERIDRGDFDSQLEIPFASRKLLKSLVTQKMNRKVETNATPVLSDVDLDECVKEVRETAAQTAGLFLWAGILEKSEEGLKVSEVWDKILNPPQN